MPRFALSFDPGSPAPEMGRLLEPWEEALAGSARPTDTSRTVLPGLAAINIRTGFFNNHGQPARGGNGTIYLWLDGEIWDRRGAADRAGVALRPDLSDAELCLALYLREGDRFCDRLNGQYVIAVFDAARDRLLVCNDRYAFRPLFWEMAAGRFVCATEIKALLAIRPGRAALDPGGVLELFAYGYQMGARTLFEEVRALRPMTRLIVEKGTAREERCGPVSFASPSRASEAELAEELAQRLRTAAERQSGGPGRVGMALSAGLDSRMVLAALPSASERRSAYTIGYDESLDLAGARELALIYGWRHLHLAPGACYLSRVAAETVRRTEGCFPFIEATSIQFHDRLRPELDILLTGHGGGALSGQTLRPSFGRALPDLETDLFSRALALPPEALGELFVPRAWDGEWSAAQRRFAATVEALGEHAGRRDDALIAWNMLNRQARFTHHSAQVDRYDFEVRAPLLDYDLVDFLLTVPYKYRFAQRLYKRTLAEHFPEAARVPWSKTGRPVPGRPADILTEFYLGGAYRQAVKKIPTIHRRRKDRVRTYRVIADEIRWDARLRYGILDPFLRSDHFPDDLLDREHARRVIAEHWSGEKDHVHALACLATLALVYRHFLDGDRRSVGAGQLESVPGAA